MYEIFACVITFYNTLELMEQLVSVTCLVIALFLDRKNETKILAELLILKGKYE